MLDNNCHEINEFTDETNLVLEEIQNLNKLQYVIEHNSNNDYSNKLSLICLENIETKLKIKNKINPMTISHEGIVDKVKETIIKLFETLIKVIKTIWFKVKQFIYSVFNNYDKIIKNCNEVKNFITNNNFKEFKHEKFDNSFIYRNFSERDKTNFDSVYSIATSTKEMMIDFVDLNKVLNTNKDNYILALSDTNLLNSIINGTFHDYKKEEEDDKDLNIFEKMRKSFDEIFSNTHIAKKIEESNAAIVKKLHQNSQLISRKDAEVSTKKYTLIENKSMFATTNLIKNTSYYAVLEYIKTDISFKKDSDIDYSNNIVDALNFNEIERVISNIENIALSAIKLKKEFDEESAFVNKVERFNYKNLAKMYSKENVAKQLEKHIKNAYENSTKYDNITIDRIAKLQYAFVNSCIQNIANDNNIQMKILGNAVSLSLKTCVAGIQYIKESLKNTIIEPKNNSMTNSQLLLTN